MLDAIAASADVPMALRNNGTVAGGVTVATAISVTGNGNIRSAQSIDNFGTLGVDVSLALSASVTGTGDISSIQSIRNLRRHRRRRDDERAFPGATAAELGHPSGSQR